MFKYYNLKNVFIADSIHIQLLTACMQLKCSYHVSGTIWSNVSVLHYLIIVQKQSG